MDLTYFNPLAQREPDFLANFVARHGTLEYFVRQLRLVRSGQAAKPHLIVAPRGFGKTSLLRRIALAVRADEDLSTRFIALTFREEQHNVISLDVFWRNCLQALAEVREDEEAPADEIARLDAAWLEFSPRQALGRAAQDGEPAWHEFEGCCQRLKRRPLLLIDNLDTLLAGLEEPHQWALRGILQREDGPVLIAASSGYPGSTHDSAAAFYEFFRVQTLDKLTNAEVMQCLRTLALRRADRGREVVRLLDENPGRIAALNALAGGNPRILNVLYGVLESQMSEDVLSQLSAMLDSFTAWYQARTEEMSMQGRAVFDALALHWDPMTAAKLGETTGLDTAAVSSHLSRLEKAGFVETVALSSRGKGRNGYQVSERFFNIWYLMRNGSRRRRHEIKFLTVFLQACFSDTERRSMARLALDEGNTQPGYSLALANSLRRGSLRDQLLEYALVESTRLGQQDEYGALIEEMRQKRHLASLNEGQLSLEQQIARYDRVIEKLRGTTKPNLREKLASAFVDKALALFRLGRKEDVIAVHDSFVAQLGDGTEPALRKRLAVVLLAKGVALRQLDRWEESLLACDRLVSQLGQADDPVFWEFATLGLLLRSIVLRDVGRPKDEIEADDRVVAHIGDASDPTSRSLVAAAILHKAGVLRRLECHEQALETFDLFVERFGEASDPIQRDMVARALLGQGATLERLRRDREAELAYRNVIALKTPQAAAWKALGNLLLDRTGDPGGAMEAFTQGLAVDSEGHQRASLHANHAYALALHQGDAPLARAHVQLALADGTSVAAAGRSLLEALTNVGEPAAARWPRIFEQIGKAVESGDSTLWSDYLGDLQRLLWYVIANGQGNSLRQWMEDAQYPMRYAPLYHAVVAAVDGEDHLLRVNPEVRKPAAPIHEGIARRLRLYSNKRRQ